MWKQGRQEEDNHHTHGHSHTNLHCNQTKTEKRANKIPNRHKVIHKLTNYVVNGATLTNILIDFETDTAPKDSDGENVLLC